jgi:hypothetical protein
MSMKARIAVLALALAFVAAPALGAIARGGCPPCGMPTADAGPCTALSVAPCCGDVTPAAPASAPLAVPTLHALANTGVAVLVSTFTAPVRVAHEPSASLSPQRLSVVRRL